MKNREMKQALIKRTKKNAYVFQNKKGAKF